MTNVMVLFIYSMRCVMNVNVVDLKKDDTIEFNFSYWKPVNQLRFILHLYRTDSWRAGWLEADIYNRHVGLNLTILMIAASITKCMTEPKDCISFALSNCIRCVYSLCTEYVTTTRNILFVYVSRRLKLSEYKTYFLYCSENS